ncbi:MAG: glycosyltransferase [Bacteroidota bacterium]
MDRDLQGNQLMSSKKKILLICDANLPRAPRVRMAYEALKEDFHFTMAGYDAPPYQDVDYIRLPKKKKAARKSITWHLGYPAIFRKFFSVFVKIYLKATAQKEDKRSIKDQYISLFNNVDCDLIINHHLNTLEMAVALKERLGVPLVSNLHEYYPREFEDQEVWLKYEAPKKLFICQTFLPKADKVFSVCEGIKQEYLANFGVDSIVIRNDKPYQNIEPKTLDPDGPIRLIHHGAALRSRKLHHLIEAVAGLEGFELDLMLLPTQQDYFDELKDQSSRCANINIVQAVMPDQIIEFISNYDVGVYILEPTNFNQQMALPNKLFEFIQARLAIAITPNEEMARIVNEYELGEVSKDYTPSSFRELLSELDHNSISRFKVNANKHARELSSEVTQQTIRDTIKQLVQ